MCVCVCIKKNPLDILEVCRFILITQNRLVVPSIATF